ncbi:uncharacterized protein LOC125052007 [Pieris napi]|uniref:uncharacterized protein LOC125052007 n=1 Tax=Pieris napi TaxID=78633 RepID=UPI001FBA9D7F|nr:uncharacterized protein LOC125052007 [Pieris napi]
MLRFALLCLGFLAVAFNDVEALNQVDKMKLYAIILPTVQECSSKYGVSEEDIKKSKESKNIDNLDDCFIACVFKKAGVINDGGQFDVEKSKELISKYLSDSGDQAKAQEIIGRCVSVNDQPVGDNEGCQRSKMLMECFLPFKKESDAMDAFKQKYAELVMSCMEEYPIDQSDIEQLKNLQMPDKESVKCLFACAYKKAGMMTDDGKLSVEGTNKLAETYLANDEEQLKRAKAFTDACKSVNDEEVSDGTKGCERAALIFKCSNDKAKEYGFTF